MIEEDPRQDDSRRCAEATEEYETWLKEVCGGQD